MQNNLLVRSLEDCVTMTVTANGVIHHVFNENLTIFI